MWASDGSRCSRVTRVTRGLCTQTSSNHRLGMAALTSDATSETLTDADVAILRADTPSSARWIHLGAAGASISLLLKNTCVDILLPHDPMKTVLDSKADPSTYHISGASPSPTPVLEANIAHLEREVEVGGYMAEAEAAGDVDQVYESAARLLSVTPQEIAIVDSST